MDKLSKSILDFMTKQPNGTSCTCSIDDDWDHMADISIRDLATTVNASEDDTKSAIAYLVDEHLIEYNRIGSKAGSIPISFHLTHKGLHYKEFQHLTKKEQWQERLWGFIFGAIIATIPWLLSLIIQ